MGMMEGRKDGRKGQIRVEDRLLWEFRRNDGGLGSCSCEDGVYNGKRDINLEKVGNRVVGQLKEARLKCLAAF